jgi:hypothetical protein
MLIMGLVGTICVVCCVAAWVGISIIDEDADVQEPQVLVDTEVTIDTTSLPENPTIADWYPIGLQVLQDNGWDLSPNLTSIGVVTSCGSSLVLDRVQLDFVDHYFDGFRPGVKWGRVSLDRHSNTASVHISYQALQWVWLSGIDLAGVKVGAQEALEIADRYEGQQYRESANDKCKMAIDLGSSGWRIRYRENDGSRWEDWAIWVDAETGAVKIE